MSSTPSDHPMVKLTVTVVDGRVHPMVTSCIEPVVTPRLSVWPASSANLSVPALVLNTRRLCRTRGAGGKAKVRQVPVESAKQMLLLESTLERLGHAHSPVTK